jgi:hypothetical protein
MENGPAKKERTRRTRAEIAELIATYRQSGQKQREFCQQRGIGLSTLQNYLRRERSDGQPQQRLSEVEVVPKATAGRSPALEIIASCLSSSSFSASAELKRRLCPGSITRPRNRSGSLEYVGRQWT